MPLDYLGRRMFPREEQWQSRRQFKTIVMVFVVALAFASMVGALMYLMNVRK